MDARNALIVDDEAHIRELIEMTLIPMGVDCTTAGDLTDAYRLLKKNKYELCITDMRLPDGDGMELVTYIQKHHSTMPVTVITAHGNVELAVDALKLGAFDFISKPFELSTLRDMVKAALRISQPEGAQKTNGKPLLLGNSDTMEKVRGMIGKLARSQAPIFISGESGTGKELAARMIHSQGPRATAPFVPVNCGAIPENLVESEFFGHKKGSFTGATADKAGLFQSAQGGTLFLDEVADLPLQMQVKLLRAIQERAVRPVGGTQEMATDVRILSATHKNLAKLVEEGNFRQDLFYRLNVIELNMPSLRERPEDTPVLVVHVLERLSQSSGMNKPDIHPDAMAALRAYSFPGNVRELENTLERALALCDGKVIQTDDLGLPEGDVLRSPMATPAPATQTTAPDSTNGAAAPTVPASDAPPPSNLEGYLEDLERVAISKALEATRYNKTAAAEKLGISFRALRYRLKKLGLD